MVEDPLHATHEGVVLIDQTGHRALGFGRVAAHEVRSHHGLHDFTQRAGNRPTRPPGIGFVGTRRDGADVVGRIELEAGTVGHRGDGGCGAKLTDGFSNGQCVVHRERGGYGIAFAVSIAFVIETVGAVADHVGQVDHRERVHRAVAVGVGVVNTDAARVEAVHGRVEDRRGHRAAKTHARLFCTGGVVHCAAQQQDVGNHGFGLRHVVAVGAVGFNAARVVAALRGGVVALLDDGVLNVAFVAFVVVEVVVVVAGQNGITQVDGAAKPFDAVILVVVNLDELKLRAVAHALQGQAVDFVVGACNQTAFSNAHVAQHTAVVRRVVAAKGANEVAAFAFNVADGARAEAGAGVAAAKLRGKTLNHHAAPFTQTVKISVKAAEGDGVGGRAVGHQL